jgi:uncharacterized protein YrrD
MRLAKDLIGKPIISISGGRQLGTVKDVYLDSYLTEVGGVYLGPVRLLGRRARLIQGKDVTVFGVDAVLVKNPQTVTDSGEVPEWSTWVRRDRLHGRQAATAGGTRVGMIEDVILDESMQIIGFRFGRVFVEGPIAERRALVRGAVLDVGSEDDTMIIDLSIAERQGLPSE